MRFFLLLAAQLATGDSPIPPDAHSSSAGDAAAAATRGVTSAHEFIASEAGVAVGALAQNFQEKLAL
jgi:hypothetical protein